jgi:ectoine hydroxylase-related dioxygenase (phytanoyl-CoA dioxygenase family)
VGDDIIFQSESQLLVSAPQAVDQIWHTDNTRPGLTVVIPLVDVSAANGPTEVIVNSHRLVEAAAEGRWSDLCSALWGQRAGGMVSQEAAFKAVLPSVPAGSAVVFDSRSIHRGRGNLTDCSRPILVFRYDYVDTPPPDAGFDVATYATRFGGSLVKALGNATA